MGAAIASRPLEGVRVLVVDDNPDLNEVVREILSGAGALVDTAESAQEAFLLFQRFRPSVLLSDIAMPLEDGYSLVRRLRALLAEQGGEVPVIALTAYTDAAHRRLSETAGFALHLSKPIQPQALIAAISRVHELSRAARAND